jgi:hypothetical protein
MDENEENQDPNQEGFADAEAQDGQNGDEEGGEQEQQQ